MRSNVCTVCKRPIDGSSWVYVGGKWFCSPEHQREWESRSIANRSRRWLLGVVVPAVVLLAWFFLEPASGSKSHTKADSTSALVKLALSALDPKPFHARSIYVLLSPKAARVADEFVYAEYATHDCATLSRLGRQITGVHGQVTVPVGSQCADWLKNDRENDAHLVRGSRVIEPSCGGGTESDPLMGFAIATNECFKYAVVGRYVTDHGQRIGECNGAYVDVMLEPIHGKWFVIGETDTDDWGGGCFATDVKYWKHRVPWR